MNLKKVRKTMIVAATSLLLFSCTKETNNYTTPGVNPPVNGQGTPTPPPAQGDGTINGGGGKGVACTTEGKKSLEILDFYEARLLYGLDVPENLNSKEEAVEKLAQLVGRHYANADTVLDAKYFEGIKKKIDAVVLNKIKFISADKKLNATNDSFEPLIGKSCEIVQIAVFYDESTLLVDKSLWDGLNWTNRIGLVAHELFYSLHRQKGATNSVMTRKLVGQLFSTVGAVAISAGVPKDQDKSVHCLLQNQSTKAYAASFDAFVTKRKIDDNEYESDGVEFVFKSLYKQPILFRTSLFFSGWDQQDLKSCLYEGKCRRINSASSPLYVESYDTAKQTVYLNTQRSPSNYDKTSPIGHVGPIPIDQKPPGVEPLPLDPQPLPVEPKPITPQPLPIPITNPDDEYYDIALTFTSEVTSQEPSSYLVSCHRELSLHPEPPQNSPEPPQQPTPTPTPVQPLPPSDGNQITPPADNGVAKP